MCPPPEDGEAIRRRVKLDLIADLFILVEGPFFRSHADWLFVHHPITDDINSNASATTPHLVSIAVFLGAGPSIPALSG